MVRIEILSGPEAGTVAELAPGRHVVGRAAGTTLRLNSETVSGRHAELQVGADGVVRFHDLGSTNGTWSAGVRVQEGEWFAGSELRLGSVRLRLLEPQAAAGGAAAGAEAGGSEEGAVHRRALEEAMAGRGGGAWKLALAGLLVLGAGAAYWFFLHGRGGDQETASSAPAGGGPEAGAPQQDWIEDHGRFRVEDAGAWSLAPGMSFAEGSLRSDGGRGRAVLAGTFPAAAASLELSAERSGELDAWAEIEWGGGAQEAAAGRIASEALGAGPVSVPLPAGAEWFRLALVLAGQGSLSALRVQGGGPDVTLAESVHEGHALAQYRGNLVLSQRDGGLHLRIVGAGLTWTPVAGGVDASAAGAGAWLRVEAGAATLDSGPFLLLSEGGALALAAGVRADASPGLLIGGEARRLLLRCEPQVRAEAQGEGALLTDVSSLHLRWDLTQAYSEAARLSREIENAALAGDGRSLLAASAQLLRDWPLEEQQMERALRLRGELLAQGRRQLNALQVSVREALFLGSAAGMERLHPPLQALADGLPGTDVAREAEETLRLLSDSAREARRESDARDSAYRARLLGALQRNYPLLAAWIRQGEQEQS
ncbi:MAG: FHA domain-containing protein [Planctomycetota bacterium]|nr:MAG: FHA domain-containing protein [Planctomycetota bacterium]